MVYSDWRKVFVQLHSGNDNTNKLDDENTFDSKSASDENMLDNYNLPNNQDIIDIKSQLDDRNIHEVSWSI